MQTLKIEIPDGYQVDHFDVASGEIKFKPKPKDLTQRIKTLDDAVQLLGYTDNDVDKYQKLSKLLGYDDHVVNYQAAVVITKAFNEGWVPDWKNSKEIKYYAYFEMDGSSGFRYGDYGHWSAGSHVGSRLAFKNKAHCEYAGKQFIDVYKQFMTIKK